MKIEISKGREEAKQVVDGLNKFNQDYLPYFMPKIYESVDLIAKNNDDEIVGGLLGGIGPYAGFYVRTFWINKTERGKGLGEKILRKAESLAKDKGATLCILDTFTFQAEDFYKKMNYKETGRIHDYPIKGEDNVFFKKEL